MRIRIHATLMFLLSLGLVPAVAFAAACENYALSPEQVAYLEGQELEIAVPEGNVPTIQRCDVNEDNVVDIHDIRAISRNRNQPSAHPDDPMDWDGNHVINVRDARGCQRACALPRCATPREAPPPEEEPLGGESAAAECSQSDDFDGDGSEDFIGMYEHTGDDERGGGWSLELVILNEDASGNIQHVTYPYTGQISASSGDLGQHLSMQPAGVVDLNPGTLVVDKTSIVSYRNGEPKVIYYYVNGVLSRAFFGIDD